ncbi:MAG: hypothetical protein ACE5HA_12100, partial [Anaerolineae bacterium]
REGTLLTRTPRYGLDFVSAYYVWDAHPKGVAEKHSSTCSFWIARSRPSESDDKMTGLTRARREALKNEAGDAIMVAVGRGFCP